MNEYRVIIASSGDFTLKVIDKLRTMDEFNIIGVLPDPSAHEYNIEYKEKLFERDIKFIDFENVAALEPDLIFSMEYRRMLPAKIVENYFCLNLHGGILPKYRGISANAYAIMNGEKEVGFTLHRTTKDLDAGEIYRIFRTPMAYEQTYSDVNSVLKEMVLREIGDTIVGIMQGKIESVPNDRNCVYCNKFHEEDGIVTNWQVTSRDLYNQWRCFAKPLGTGLHFLYRGETYYAEKWVEGSKLGIDDYKGFPGKIVFRNDEGVYVKTLDNVIVLQNIFDKNGNRVSYGSFTIGLSMWGGG